MKRETDAGIVNACVQRDFHEADLSEALAEPLHVCLMEGESGAMFMWRGPGIYEAHLFFTERGKAAAQLFDRMLERMRVIYGAKLFWSLIPPENRAAAMFVRRAGAKSHGILETRDGPRELFVMENV